MCRMIAVRSKDGTSPYDYVKAALLEWCSSNSHGTGVSYFDSEGEMTYFKSPNIAKEHLDAAWWEKEFPDEDGKRWAAYVREFDANGGKPTMVGHVRYAVSGSTNGDGAHPFAGERNGKHIHITHNGWVHEEKTLEDEMKKLGFDAPSGVDSEWLKCLISHVGMMEFPGWLVKHGISGKLNVLLHREDGLIQAYSHGDLEYYEDEHVVIIATESFIFPGEERERFGWYGVPPGTVVTVGLSGEVHTATVTVPKRPIRRKENWWDGADWDNVVFCHSYAVDSNPNAPRPGDVVICPGYVDLPANRVAEMTHKEHELVVVRAAYNLERGGSTWCYCIEPSCISERVRKVGLAAAVRDIRYDLLYRNDHLHDTGVCVPGDPTERNAVEYVEKLLNQAYTDVTETPLQDEFDRVWETLLDAKDIAETDPDQIVTSPFSGKLITARALVCEAREQAKKAYDRMRNGK